MVLKRKRDDCTLDPAGKGVYHVRRTGSDVYCATIEKIPNNPYLRRWRVRPYGQPDIPWKVRSSAEDAIGYALSTYVSGQCST